LKQIEDFTTGMDRLKNQFYEGNYETDKSHYEVSDQVLEVDDSKEEESKEESSKTVEIIKMKKRVNKF
jgi:hypothetical protein